MFLFLAGVASAQVAGRLGGSVVDPSGAAVAGASVRIFLRGGSEPVLTGKTNAAGLFVFASIRPETYEIQVEAPGFAKSVTREVKVNPIQETSLSPIKLEVAAASQTVVVTENVTTVQTDSSEVSQSVTQSQIQNLPVLDRQISTLYITQAGVTNSRTTSSINGLRPSYTNVLLDGVNIQDSVRTNALDYMPSKLTIGQVAEMTVATSNANPTIGGNATTISLTTPSGTNSYHGNGYWYNRNSYFAANNWFSNKNKVARPFENLNQLGGSVGGPIIKDKLLFFANYEAYRDKANSPKNTTILTPEARQGIFRYKVNGAVQSFNILTAQQIGIDPFMQSELAMMPTVGNNSSIGDGLNTTGYSFNARSNETRDNVTGKLDYYLTPKNSFSGSFMWNRDIVDRPDQGSYFTSVPPIYNDNNSKFLSVSWRSNPKATLTNELRGGFSRQPSAWVNTQANPKFFVTNASVIFTSPVSEVLPEGRNVNNYSLQDNANWVRGRHSVAFGVQANLFRSSSYGYSGTVPAYNVGLAPTSPYGFVNGGIPGASSADIGTANNLLTTLGGIISSASQTFNAASRTSGFVAGAPSLQDYRQNNYAPYVSDTWKIRRNFTLTLGLRWEYFSPVDEANAMFVQPRVDNGSASAALLGNATLDFAGSAVGRPLYKKDTNNFGPNVGFAWDVFGDGKTAVRGGYSIAYGIDNSINSIYNSGATNNGLFSTRSLANLNAIVSKSLPTIQAPPFQIPTTSKDQFNLAPNSPPVQSLVDPNLVTPYVQQWNFGVQRELKGFVLEGRYVGNHAVKMYRVIDLNQINVNQEGFLQDFIKARNNGFLALNQLGSFNANYNANVAGSQPLPFFDKLPNKGALTSSSIVSALRSGQVGSLAQTYQSNLYFPHDGFSYFPNPYVLYSALLTNYSNSSYNAGQFEIRKRTAGGMQFQANYTFSKVLSDALATRGLEALLDNNNPGIERARAPFDVTHSFKLNHSVPLPFGAGHRFRFQQSVLNKVVGGWTASGFLHVDSGPPVSILSALGTLNRAARSGGNTVDVTGNLDALKSATGFFMTPTGPYFVDPSHIGSDGRAVAPDGAAPFNGQLFYNPQPGTVGSLQRRVLSGPWFKNYNFSLSKETRIRERHSIQFRADFYNIFNHPNFFVGDQTVSSASFGKITSMQGSGEGTTGSGGARALQFGLFYRF